MNLIYKLYEILKSVINEEVLNIGGLIIGVFEVWNLKDLFGKLFDGKGMKIVIIDFGVDYIYFDLKVNYIGGYDMVDEDNDLMDGNVYGIYVVGIIVGNGKIKGVVLNVFILVYCVMNDGGIGIIDDII